MKASFSRAARTTVLGIFLGSILSLTMNPQKAFANDSALPWRNDLTPKEFSDAKAEKKLILLNLEAIWCHWCHVMAEKTYADSKVSDTLKSKYILVKVDQDSRPDLSNRYQDYGWPATIIINPQGEDVRKFAGFVEPEEFETALEEAVKNPKPSETTRKVVYQTQSALDEPLKETLKKKHESALDRELGGLKTNHKYLEVDTTEYLLRQMARGDEASKAQVEKTLKAAESLIDPVWGGVYQYSVHRNWNTPHYEKLIINQAEYIRLYALASRISQDPELKARYIDDAKSIFRYVKDFLLSPDNTFYTSQDADLVQGEESAAYRKLNDAERRAKGIPKVDKNVYADRNGRMIRALVSLYRATGDESSLNLAEATARKMIESRSLPGSAGGFKHGEKGNDGPYLADTLYMGIGFLELYSVTGERSWLDRAMSSADFIQTRFSGKSLDDGAGLESSPSVAGVLSSQPHLPENIEAVRFFNLLNRYSGKDVYKKLAEKAMRYLATPEISNESITEIGIVIADEELSSEPAHITVVASKSDPAGKMLSKAAQAVSAPYLRTEWWDKAEGPMPNPDVQYPSFAKAAAFVCAERRCSLPIFKPEDIARRLKEFGASK